MKTSNLLLLAAGLVLLGSLSAYNMALRAEYRRGTYKDPLREYRNLGLKNFDEVAVPAGGSADVKVVAGPYAVRLHPELAQYVRVSQQGRRLTVTAAFEGHHRYLPGEAVVISCPRLAALSTDATYALDGRPVAEKASDFHHRVLVQGFGQDSLRVRADRASRVELAGNRLGYLAVVAGPTPGSHAAVLLHDDNRVAAADLRLDHQSELVLNRVALSSLRQQVADSARLTLAGAALPAWLRPAPQRQPAD